MCGTQHGERKTLKYPTTIEVEDSKLASGFDGVLDDVELTAIRCPQMRDGDLVSDELTDAGPFQVLDNQIALNRLSSDDQQRLVRGKDHVGIHKLPPRKGMENPTPIRDDERMSSLRVGAIFVPGSSRQTISEETS